MQRSDLTMMPGGRSDDDPSPEPNRGWLRAVDQPPPLMIHRRETHRSRAKAVHAGLSWARRRMVELNLGDAGQLGIALRSGPNSSLTGLSRRGPRGLVLDPFVTFTFREDGTSFRFSFDERDDELDGLAIRLLSLASRRTDDRIMALIHDEVVLGAIAEHDRIARPGPIARTPPVG